MLRPDLRVFDDVVNRGMEFAKLLAGEDVGQTFLTISRQEATRLTEFALEVHQLEVHQYDIIPIKQVLPICLQEDLLNVKIIPEKLTPSLTETTGCTPKTAILAPAYFPVSQIFVKSSHTKLVKAITHTGVTKSLIEIGHTSFVRDYYVNAIDLKTKASISLHTTKGPLKGWGAFPPVSESGPDVTVGRHFGNGQGYGGNFLCAQGKGGLFYVYGFCADAPLISLDCCRNIVMEPLCKLSTEPSQMIAADVGWLRVGHIDEIISFPSENVMLFASPGLYKKIRGLEFDDLNRAVEAKMQNLASQLAEAIGVKPIPMPVWFHPVGDKCTSTRGNPVNCVYLNDFSIHSKSGRVRSPETPPNFAPNSKIDDSVSEIMKDLGYKALFIDMSDLNNESGAGGNVHCCTYVEHSLPSDFETQ